MDRCALIARLALPAAAAHQADSPALAKTDGQDWIGSSRSRAEHDRAARHIGAAAMRATAR